MSMSISLLQKQQSPRGIQNLPNLPRFNRQFIGIGHHLEQKKKQRKKVEEEQRTMANRVIFLQKQQQRAQKNLYRKKSELNKMMHIIQRTNQQKQEKQQIRRMRQIQLEMLREQNNNRRQFHKQLTQSMRYSLQNQKHNEYSRIKSFIKEKQQEKQNFLFQDLQGKKDRWLNINLQKEKGKQQIDKYYKKKNTEHTMNYLQKIQKQQITKQQKINTIKHLQQFQTVLKKKLQESTMKVSQVQQKILKTSRTLDVSRHSPPTARKTDLVLPKTTKRTLSKLSQYDIKGSQDSIYIHFNRDQQTSSDRQGYLTQRDNNKNRLLDKNNEQQIQEKINDNLDQIQMSGFKIIRTTKRRRKNPKNRYKQYQF